MYNIKFSTHALSLTQLNSNFLLNTTLIGLIQPLQHKSYIVNNGYRKARKKKEGKKKEINV